MVQTSPLALLKVVDVKRVTIITLAFAIAILCAFVHQQNVELSRTKLVYLHPQTARKKARRTETGAVRIITRIVERPSGEKETYVDETRAPTVETEVVSEAVAPVALATAMAPPRTDRFLFGGDLASWNPNSLSSYTLYAGYSFRNRVDVMLGAGRPAESVEGHLMMVFRF